MSISVRTCSLVVAFALCGLDAAPAQERSAPVSDVRYDVTFDATTAQSHTIHVDMTFTTRGRDPVILSLPAWSPGSYELDNFARYVMQFSARSGATELQWDKVDYDTWRTKAVAVPSPASKTLLKKSFSMPFGFLELVIDHQSDEKATLSVYTKGFFLPDGM